MTATSTTAAPTTPSIRATAITASATTAITTTSPKTTTRASRYWVKRVPATPAPPMWAAPRPSSWTRTGRSAAASCAKCGATPACWA
ncbi:hypothetical protein G6F23_014928 [Rhizopus arrhizus]|nr:hypothetical protein G6F23_014928 [Rhizopus arrhizus]